MWQDLLSIHFQVTVVCMSKWKNQLLLAVFFSVSLVGAFYFFRSVGSGSLVDAVEVDWRNLAELDYITGAAPEALKKLDDKMVKIPGFMVPLEDNMKDVSTFLLVPTPQACIHVPPPPPNQMVLIEMKSGSNTKAMYGPIWVYGILSLHSKRHTYGESSFQMQGIAVEPYR